MEIAIRGSSPCATTTAILLISKARQLGMHITVTLVGDPDDLALVYGPTVIYSPVLASCGIGRDFGQGATVVVPGAPGHKMWVSLSPNGTDNWFSVTRNGLGEHVATQAYVRMARDPRVEARKVGKAVRTAMDILGMSAEPAVLDMLFGAPAPPLVRLALALRVGRSMSGQRGEPITRYLTGSGAKHEPLTGDLPDDFMQRYDSGEFEWILNSIGSSVRDYAEEWLEHAFALAKHDDGRDLDLAWSIMKVASQLSQLPAHCILPPLSAHEDAVANSLGSGLNANGDVEVSSQLSSMFRFLGGSYAESAEYAYDVDLVPPPKDPIERWQWFCDQAVLGRQRADELWPLIVDPPQ